MKPLSDIRGLRYPDEMLIRMFFKLKLDKKPGRVLEFGCSNGNNLALFHAFGWQCTGIDIDDKAIANGLWNFGLSPNIEFLTLDLAQDNLPIEENFSAILFPSINYYLPRERFIYLLEKSGRCILPGGIFFIRCRSTKDWRFGKGREINHNSYILQRSETGELGLLNVFYEADELLALVQKYLGNLTDIRLLHIYFENPQNGLVVGNDDIVIWGRTGSS